jgi:hypothetical protein
MAKSKVLFLDKLKKLEEEKQQLITKRKEEIFAIIDKAAYLEIDDQLLLGAMLMIKELSETSENKLSPESKSILEQIRSKSQRFFRKKSSA